MDFIAPDIAHLNLAEFMQEALLEAELAGQCGELPIGAVIVIDGEIILMTRGGYYHVTRVTRKTLEHHAAVHPCL